MRNNLRALLLSAFAASLAVAGGNDADANANDASGVGSEAHRRRVVVDCSEYQHTFEMPFSGGAVVMDYVVTGDTFRARLTRQGTGWVGLAVPQDPNCMLCMKNSDAVIGVPGGSVLKYDLEAYKLDGVVPMEESRQTLEETSVVESDGTTVVTFVKKLVEDGENGINGNGPNTFLWAMGPEGLREELAYHILKGKFQLDLTPCNADAVGTSMGTELPTGSEPTSSSMPVSAPTAVSEATPSDGGVISTDSPTISTGGTGSDGDMMGNPTDDVSVTSGGGMSDSMRSRSMARASTILLFLSSICMYVSL